MADEIPPPPPGKVPNLPTPQPGDFSVPSIRVWYYAGPIILDVLAIVCTTILVALNKLPVENFKYLIGVLVVGNMALRMPGANKQLPPGGGGFIVALVGSLLHLKGFRS